MRVLFWQAFRYGLVGLSVTAADWLIYYVLTRGVPVFHERYVLSSVISFSIAVVYGYLAHRRVTFRVNHGAHRSQFPKFVAVTLIGLALNTLVLQLGIAQFALYDLTAKFIAAILTALWNFTGQRLWTFRAPGPYTGPVDVT